MTEPHEPNPYLLLGFWEFAIMSTLMIVFFPWSLLFCFFVYGIDDTKAICAALIHDALKTIIAVAAGVVTLSTLALVIFLSI